MPELPEVETVRRQLAQEIVGEVVSLIEVRREGCFVGKPDRVRSERITKVLRRGKYLFIVFQSGRGLTVHLKMTGRLVIEKDWYETAPHTRVVMRMVSGRSLYFWDTRAFGYVKEEEEIEKAQEKVRARLGPEPGELTEIEFLRKLQKTGRKVKDALLDQTILAGVGNIYANDALHLAQILPTRKANTITLGECRKLLLAIREVLKRGLETNGASDNSYLDAYGEKGGYQNEFRVYGKTKGECPVCGLKLIYGKVGGRGTWWCTTCQG